ncbi:hypothetical protein ACLB2K_056236 [Fragaria x ananassa]
MSRAFLGDLMKDNLDILPALSNLEEGRWGGSTHFGKLGFCWLMMINLVALPTCIFHAESLRSLMVEFDCKIQVPSFAFSSNLKYLELTSVTIVDEGFFKWISCCCNCIEQLYLDDVYGPKSITIQSSSLKSFRFESSYSSELSQLHISGEKLKELSIEWTFDSPMEISLYMFTPNLEKINWFGNLMNHLNLGKFVCLEEAEIGLQPAGDDWNNVFQVLCSLRGAKDVILTEQLIKTSRFNTEFWAEFWEQDPAFFNELQDFTIELWEGSNGIELARYILEHAQNLEKMVIAHLPRHSDVEMVVSKSKMIANATLVFKSVPHHIDP